MARRLGVCLFVVTLFVSVLDGLLVEQVALAAGLDQKGEADAKEATRLFKQGRYEEAAPIYAKLSVDYPDMDVFERNLGACFYHMRKPEPALSNLRHYLNHKKNIGAEDKATVERWIDEMEKLRAQNEATNVPPKPTAPLIVAAQSEQPKRVDAVAPNSDSMPAVSPLTTEPRQTNTPSAALDLSVHSEPASSVEVSPPIYKRWWFWTGAAAIVAAGTVTAVLVARHSDGPCANASLACLEAK